MKDEKPYICREQCWQLYCKYSHQNKGFYNEEGEQRIRFHLGINCGTSVCPLDVISTSVQSVDIRIDIEIKKQFGSSLERRKTAGNAGTSKLRRLIISPAAHCIFFSARYHNRPPEDFPCSPIPINSCPPRKLPGHGLLVCHMPACRLLFPCSAVPSDSSRSLRFYSFAARLASMIPGKRFTCKPLDHANPAQCQHCTLR